MTTQRRAKQDTTEQNREIETGQSEAELNVKHKCLENTVHEAGTNSMT